MFPSDVAITKFNKSVDSRGELVITHEGAINDVVAIKRSISKKNVLRGLHFQEAPHTQRKIIEVIDGSIIGMLINMDVGSSNYGKFYSMEIHSADGQVLHIPSHYAHGFITITDVVFQYLTIGAYSPDAEIAISPPKNFYEVQNIESSSLNISEKDRLAFCYETYFSSGKPS
jgi:dTDP-4-dehydrorhamnose 3,5-epimerase